MNSRHISAIRSEKVRNLLRGLTHNSLDEAGWKTINKLRNVESVEDANLISELLVDSPLFAHMRLHEDFPRTPVISDRRHRPSEQSLEREAFYQCLRIKKNSEKLFTALNASIELNRLLEESCFDEATGAIKCFINDYGYSIFIIRKLAYIYSQKCLSIQSRETCTEELEKHGLSRRNVISLGLVDMMGDSYDYIRLRKNLIESTSRGSQFTKDIISWIISPIRTTSDDLARQIHSHSRGSLIDSFLFLGLSSFNITGQHNEKIKEIFSETCEEVGLSAIWPRISTQSPPIQLSTDNKEFSDLDFYRQSIAWIENKNICKFRQDIDQFYMEPNLIDRNLLNCGAHNEYFNECTPDDIATKPNLYDIKLDLFDKYCAGAFTRTAAFIFLLRKGIIKDTLSSDILLRILDLTSDIAYLCHPEELKQMSSPKQDKLYNYLVSALIADATKSNVDQHKLRRAVQDIVVNDFNGSLILFAENLYGLAPNVAQHFYQLCTENFLGQLFFLLPGADAAFETKAQLHDWYSARFNDTNAKERAKTLRVDRRLQKVRGAIDDTRIYVDPVRFNQWVEENCLDELSSIFRSTEITQKDINEFRGFGDYSIQRQPVVRLAIVLQSAFQEFCSNKRYGIDSYLGRRIRHGTLKGFMLVPVESTIEKPEFENIIDKYNGDSYVTKWINTYSQNISGWATKFFHVRSKERPHGAIVPDITNSLKIDTTRTALKALVDTYNSQTPLSLSHIGMILFEYCWILVDKDLQIIRNTIESARSEWGVIEQSIVKKHCCNASTAISFTREINALTDTKFKSVSSWFAKPSNLSPSAPVNLLFQAVIDEVMEQIPSYRPDISRQDTPAELYGVFYHHLYDFFYVVIYNAAKHGQKDGHLIQKMAFTEPNDTHFRLVISVASQISSEHTMIDIEKAIRMEMEAPIEDAMVIEGRSGVRKLMRMQTDIPEIDYIRPYFESNMVCFEISMTLPRS